MGRLGSDDSSWPVGFLSAGRTFAARHPSGSPARTLPATRMCSDQCFSPFCEGTRAKPMSTRCDSTRSPLRCSAWARSSARTAPGATSKSSIKSELGAGSARIGLDVVFVSEITFLSFLCPTAILISCRWLASSSIFHCTICFSWRCKNE